MLSRAGVGVCFDQLFGVVCGEAPAFSDLGSRGHVGVSFPGMSSGAFEILLEKSDLVVKIGMLILARESSEERQKVGHP